MREREREREVETHGSSLGIELGNFVGGGQTFFLFSSLEFFIKKKYFDCFL